MKRSIRVVIMLILPIMLWAQGVTTAAMSGKITDDKGQALEGADVMAVHEASGTMYGAASMGDGYYFIPNMRIGGPYTITVNYIGYAQEELTDIFLNLNTDLTLDFAMKPEAMEMDRVLVTAEGGIINPNRTGAETSIQQDQLESLPSIARGSRDFTRLTPESDGNSFGGRNNLYNNFSLDGSIFNNSFGLDYATPGGQTDAQPVSLDAIEQVQVSIAPFDVREGGFTGAGVNAVTKSGTNTLRASAYHYFRNQGMVGDKVGDATVENLDFSTNQSGFSLGGPILKDKLFYFVNFEAERRNETAHNFVADDGSSTAANVSSVPKDSIELVQARLRDYWGYDPGAYQGYEHQTYNNKILAKLNWNVNSKHQISLRYNYLDSWKDILPHPEAIIGRGPTSYRLPFENSSYRIFNKIHSFVGEMHSRFSNNMANKLLIGYTAFRDERDPHSEPWPVVDIFDANGNLAITMGSEMFSTHNRLYQDVFQLTDNLTYYMDRHTLTGGLNLEMLRFENSFNLFYYPWFTFGSVKQFLDNTTDGIDFNSEVSNAQEKDYAWAYVDVAQLGLYIQDEFRASDNLKLTLGLRMDMPIYLNEIERNDLAADFEGWVDENGDPVTVDPSTWPSANPLWAPRFGFNWDVLGDRSMQLRGGSGIFNGRIPFVWLGNQASNPGILPFYTFQVNDTADEFKFPQVWKNNLAADRKFGEGWMLTLEAMFSKDLNAVVHRNFDMRKPSSNLTGTGDDRAVFAGFHETHIYSTSGDTVNFLDAGAIVLDNTDEGHQMSFTAKLSKSFRKSLNASVAYTYMESKDYTSIPAEIAADAFQRNPVVGDPNQPMFSWSRYGLKHRFISTLSYEKSYANMTTRVGAFWESGKGHRYSFTYNGDLNQDGIPANNDLLYVPENASDINFGTVVNGSGVLASDANAQWQALDAFIEQDEYLSTRRGDYAERHGAMLPWFHQLDIKASQEIALDLAGKSHRVQLSLDILNVGNMINSAWGVRSLPTTTSPLTFNGLDSSNTPWFSFNTNLEDSYVNDSSIASKWQMQLGIHYIF